MAKWLAMLLSIKCAWGQAETLNECLLKNLQGVGSDRAAFMVRRACREQVLPHVPAKCSTLAKQIAENPFSQFDPPGVQYQSQEFESCIETCVNASWWSKTYGECAP